MSVEFPKRLHVPLTEAQHRALNELSTRTGQSRAYIARTALVSYIKRELPKTMAKKKDET